MSYDLNKSSDDYNRSSLRVKLAGFPLAFQWFSCGNFFLWFSCACLPVFLKFFFGFLTFFPLVSSGSPLVFISFSLGFPMLLVFFRSSYRFPLPFLWFSYYFSDGFLLGFTIFRIFRIRRKFGRRRGKCGRLRRKNELGMFREFWKRYKNMFLIFNVSL